MASACAFSASNLECGRRSQAALGQRRKTEGFQGGRRGRVERRGKARGCFAPLLELVLRDHPIGVVFPLRIELAHGERLRARVGEEGRESAFRDVMRKFAQRGGGRRAADVRNGDASMHAAYLDVSVHLLRGLLSCTHLLYAVVRGGWPVVVHLARGAGGSASASLGGFAENGCLVGRGASRGHGRSPEKGWMSTRETMRARCRATRQTAASEVASVVYPRFRGAAEREICSEAQTVQFRLSKRAAFGEGAESSCTLP